jgi:HPt (histidine-containing phosphotransfer) domain-containing protein
MPGARDDSVRRSDRLRALQARYEKDLAEKLVQLDAAWQAVDHGDYTSDDLLRLHSLLHRLAGSGATFGFNAVSEITQRLEGFVLAVLYDDDAFDSQTRREIRDGIRALRDAAPASVVIEPAVPAAAKD